MTGWLSKAMSFSAGAGIALLAATSPQVLDRLPSSSDLASFKFWASNTTVTTPEWTCHPQSYKTRIVSTDPLLIYIEDFLSQNDIDGLLSAGDGLFKPSTTNKYGRTIKDTERTSWSAALPRSASPVQCILSRAQDFMGTMLSPGKDEIGSPQLVRYKPGQKFNKHFDWYPNPVTSSTDKGRDRKWNRPASFFAILHDNCTEGDTWFPHVKPVSSQVRADKTLAPWREHEDGGLAFKPVAGNALFWVNLHANGTGDKRTEHAGLPVKEGLKIAMNIWPKQYNGPDAWDPEEEKEEEPVVASEL